MRRPNLAQQPFLNTRPVWVVSTLAWLCALGLSAYAVVDFLSVRGQERHAAQRLQALSARATALNQEAKALSRELSAVNWRKLKAEVDAVASAASQRQLRWGPLLASLEAVLPWDVRLISITPTATPEGLTVTLEGVATNREAWLRLLTNLLRDPRFANPVPQEEQAPGSGGAVGYGFSLKVTYQPGVGS
ncbi:MAG: PilN domain-containing protein [Thermoanaerobaculum sp.]|nr:PilN domain-containing protein [Thermoanaerobaculum sp.]MDW7968437.1 hypothetical protein [Thermoanaerobaculum sp.]